MPIRELRRAMLLLALGSFAIGALTGAVLEIIHPTQEEPCST